MADISIDVSALPLDIKAKLAELDLELSEGDITQKGYEKKRQRLLQPFIKSQGASASKHTRPKHAQTAQIQQQSPHRSAPAPAQPSPSTAAQRRAHRRLTREDNRYHSEIRTEAVMQALALNKKQSMVPMPSKRTSAVVNQQRRDQTTDSSSDDDSVFDDDSSRGHGNHRGPSSSRQGNRRQEASPSSNQGSRPSSQISRGSTVYANVNIPAQPPRGGDVDVVPRPQSGEPGSALADVIQLADSPGGRPRQVSQPPDVTSQTNTLGRADRVNQYNNSSHAHAQSVRVTGNAMTGIEVEGGGYYDSMPRHGKVSAKIQQLLNTLKRPKKKKVPTATLR